MVVMEEREENDVVTVIGQKMERQMMEIMLIEAKERGRKVVVIAV